MRRLEEIGHTVSVLTGMYLLTVTDFGERSALRVETMPVGYAWSIVFSGTVGPIVEVKYYLLMSRWFCLILHINI
jgi:hypothetical protein